MTDKHEIFKKIWLDLRSSLANRHHPYYTAVFGTQNINGKPDLRTVVLREVGYNDFRITFYTDIRSEKIAQIKKKNQVCWLFYDSNEQVQLRMYGSAHLVYGDKGAKEIWDSLSKNAKKAYQVWPAPGIVISHAGDGLNNEADTGYAHFTIVNTDIHMIDWLWLGQTGHRRIAYKRNGNKWLSDWLIP